MCFFVKNVRIFFMEKFLRQPEELETDHKKAQTVDNGGKDLIKDWLNEKNRVISTAFITARCFAEQTGIPRAKELYEVLSQKLDFAKENKGIEPEQIDAPHFMELRYKSTEKVIRDALKKGEIDRVLELASGFTPHSLSLSSENNLELYIENDLPANLKIKQGIVNEFIGGLPVRFVAGNVLDENTWEKFAEQLGGKPVAVFCEGLMMYLSRDQQARLLGHVKRFLQKNGGFFMHEDMFKYHPEFEGNPRFSAITSKLKKASGSDVALDESFSQEDVTRFYEDQGFCVKRIAEDVPLNFNEYPANVRRDAEEDIKVLKAAGYSMWKLSLPK